MHSTAITRIAIMLYVTYKIMIWQNRIMICMCMYNSVLSVYL